MSKSTISTFQLFEMFPTAESARLFLESRIWSDGVTCPSCKAKENITTRKGGFYRCNPCQLDFTIRTGTIFEREAVLFTNGGAVAVDVPSMPITAPNAEMACREIRHDIRAKEPSDPLSRWDKALSDGDVGEIMSLLDGAWFGVPESTDCWNIPGFAVAVNLLDDPPEMEN